MPSFIDSLPDVNKKDTGSGSGFLDTLPQAPVSQEQTGFLQQTAQNMARPFLSAPASVASAVATGLGEAGIISPKYGEEARQSGVPFGYFGKVKPFAAKVPTSIGDIINSAAGGAADMLESASYLMAPVKELGSGFFSKIALKEALPMATAYGTAQGLRDKSKGGSVLGSAGTALGNTLGAMGAYTLMGAGGQAISRWGARALRSEAMRTLTRLGNDMAEKVWSTFPEAFKKGSIDSLDKMTNKLVYSRMRALSNEFTRFHKKSMLSFIDSTAPKITEPDLAYATFARSLSDTMGALFKKSANKYQLVKDADVNISKYVNAFDAIGLKTNGNGQLSKESAQEMKSLIMTNGMNSPLDKFKVDMISELSHPMNPKQVMSLWEDSMKQLSVMDTNEARNSVRAFSAGIYKDMRNELETNGRKDIVDNWDVAYNAYKKASRIYDSGVLNKMRNSGYVSDLVDTLASGTMKDPEKEVFLKSIDEQRPAVQNLLISEMLSKVKTNPTADSKKMIDGVLGNFDNEIGDNSLFSPSQVNYMRSVGDFANTNFGDLLSGMRGAVGLDKEPTVAEGKATQALTESAKALQPQKEALTSTVGKLVDNGKINDISRELLKIDKTSDFEKVLGAFSPEEKNLVGLALAHRAFIGDVPLGVVDKNGDVVVNKEFATKFIDTIDKITANKPLRSLLTDTQYKGLKEASDLVRMGTQIPAGDMARLVHAGLAALYGGNHYFAGATYQATQVFKANLDNPESYNVIENLIKINALKTNARFVLGDLIKKAANVVAQMGHASGEALLQNNT